MRRNFVTKDVSSLDTNVLLVMKINNLPSPTSGIGSAIRSNMKARSAHGFALIDLIFVCGIIGVLAVIAMPRLLLAKQAAGAASAIGSLRAIDSSQLTFALTCGGGFYAPSLTVL